MGDGLGLLDQRRSSTQRSNSDWLADLRGPHAGEAIADLRAFLVKGLHAALSSRVQSAELESLVEDFAQDALLRILDNLDQFRGESKFATWAQKIAINVAYSELRRRRWQNVSLQAVTETEDGEEYTPNFLADPDASPEERATQSDLMRFVRRLIAEELTDRQKEAIMALVVVGMPMAEVAERMNTNRNALYKLVHDARQRLQRAMLAEGLTPQEVLQAFE